MQINVAVTDANNIVCQVVPPQTEVITIDRGVAGNGIVSIVPVTISTFQYLRITYTNGTVQDVGPLTSTAYTATSPITIVGNTISLATVPIASGGTDATTAAGAIQNLLPSYTGNANKRLGLNSGGTALEWVADGGGTVTSIAASGGSTGLTFSGSPITSSGTLTLGGTLAVASGGTGATTAGDALTNLGAIGAITSTDGSVTITSTGTSRDLSVAVAAATNNVIAQVRNTTGATLTKGTVVYISGATGQLPTVSKAIATGDSTSAQTLGMMTADLANNSNGNVTIIGLITNIDTSAYTDGAQLYLSGTTAGAVTATKPSAPIHLVYVAVVEYAHPTQGKLFVKVQNGYELDEIHDVSIVSPVTGQTLVYNSTTDLWVNNTVSLTAGVNGTLPVANGGTGVTTSTGTGSVVLSTSPTLVTPLLGTPTSGNFSTGTFTWPTFNQNTTGTAANVTGVVAIANGGTGQTTANAAFNALAPSQAGNSGKYLTTDGTDTSWATNPLGTVTSVAMTTPTGLTVTGSPITTSGTLALTMTAGYAIPTTTSQTNWDTAYSERQQWNGGSTNLVAATGRTSLGATTLGSNIFTISNPSAVTFPRFNADNTISALDAATFRTAIGAGTSSTTGTVTSVSGTGTVNGLTLTGTVTTSGSLTLGGTLNLSSPPAIGNTTPSTGNFTTLTENSVAVVTQSDIGSAPNEIPLNQYLGSLAYQNGDGYYNTGMTVGFRNRIINGAMVIDQRNAGAAVTGQNFAVDRFQTVITAVTSAALSSQQVTDAPSNSGFIYSYKYTVTTAATSFGTGGRTGILYRIEGYDFADFVFGTTNAKTITFSFWVKSSVTGTYSIGFSNADSTRGYPATYTINSANTWEYKTIVIGGCVDGTWLTTNGRGIQIEFCLGADTSRLGTANIWNNAFVTGATGTTQLVNTVNATFQITGVQLEKGNIATSFDVRPYGTELALCQRYFQTYNGNTTVNLNDGSLINLPNWSTTEAIGAFVFPTMRTSPTFSYSALSGFRYFTAGSVFTPASILLNGANVNRLEIYVTPSSGSWTAGYSGFFRIYTSSDYLRLSAEL